MLLSPYHRVKIAHPSDTNEARKLIKFLTSEMGFAQIECEEFAIVVSELASNLVKHARGGYLVINSIEDEGRLGIKIESQDDGPGIADIEQAITDGFSTTGSLGYGLGTINRLMDEFEIQSSPGNKPGTKIICLRWQREPIRKRKICPISIGVATRSYSNQEFNGDGYIVKCGNEFALIGLIDGLGHGKYAHVAAQTAREYIENHYDRPLDEIFRGSSRACRATRGVVMALARFDWQAGPINFKFASVGNIEARVFGCSAPLKFITHRGVVGLNAPNPVVAEYDWSSDLCLVLHTDGISSLWHWNDFPELGGLSASHAARRLLQKLAKGNDDATVIIVSYRQSGDSQ